MLPSKKYFVTMYVRPIATVQLTTLPVEARALAGAVGFDNNDEALKGLGHLVCYRIEELERDNRPIAIINARTAVMTDNLHTFITKVMSGKDAKCTFAYSNFDIVVSTELEK